MLRLPHRLHPFLFAFTIAIALSAPGRASAQAACPTSELALSTSATYTTSAASLDTTYLQNRLQFNLATGTLHISYCCSLVPTYMIVRDAFDVTGVPPGTPVSLTVEVPVSGEIYDSGLCGGSGCAGGFYASIDHGADHAQYSYSSPPLYDGARISFSGVVQLPLTIIAGQPETLAFQFWARRAVGGSHGTIGDGVIRFTGLSAGQSVISCQGFAGQVTPVRRSSWGALKSHYR